MQNTSSEVAPSTILEHQLQEKEAARLFTTKSFLFNLGLNMAILGILLLIFLVYRYLRKDLHTLGKL